MSANRLSLDLIEVPSPCTVPWDSMTGGDTVRRCGQCRQNVYHLSEMSRAEAEALIREKEGNCCVQFYRRADGTVVTRDCAVVRWWRGVVSAATVVVLGALAYFGLVRAMVAEPANSTFSFVGGGMRMPSGSCTTPSAEPPAPEVAPRPHAPAAPGGER